MPELKQRVTVQLDGTISFPLLGTITVAGLPPAELRTRIQSALVTKLFRRMTQDGRESMAVIEPHEVTAAVVEYRPIYVNGDVSKPGEQTYRPFMTVRQAVAVSGGYDVMRFRTTNPFLESADLRSAYETLWTEFAKEQVQVLRIKAELENKGDFDQNIQLNTPLSPAAISQILNSENEFLKIRQADHQREKAFLLRSVKQNDESVKVLSEQLQKEEQGTQDDTEELRKVSELFNKGTMTGSRVTDSRRALLLSSTRKLQTTAQLMQVKKQRDESLRQVEKLDDQRRIILLRELQDSNLRLAEIRAKLQGVGEKLQYTGMMKSQLARGLSDKPQITVIRKGEKDRERFKANEDFELQPGDVVEIALQPEHIAEAPTQ